MNRFVKGMLIGVGAAVGFVAGLLILGGIAYFTLPHSRSEMSIVGTGNAIISEHRLLLSGGVPTLMGTVTNTSGNPITAVMLQASLFSNDGNILNQEDKYVERIDAHDTYNFKITFPCQVMMSNGEYVTTIGGRDIKSDADLHCKIQITQGFLEK